MGVVVTLEEWTLVVGLADKAGVALADGVNIVKEVPEWLVDDWDGVELGPEVVALALVPVRFKLQHNSATQAGLKVFIDVGLNKM